MARRGDTARQAAMETIKEAFGANFVGVVDKKLYVMADDGGEMIQFAIAMTMPKNPIEVDGSNGADGQVVAPLATPTELSTEDKEKVNALMKKLGIAT